MQAAVVIGGDKVTSAFHPNPYKTQINTAQSPTLMRLTMSRIAHIATFLLVLVNFSSHFASAQKKTCVITPPDTAGPFFQFDGVPNKGGWICRPEFQNRDAKTEPVEVELTGRVLDEDCTTALNGPKRNVLLHVWQADADGVYDDHKDESSHYCRGLIDVGKKGDFTIRSILPGQYGFGNGVKRPRHFHFKVSADGYEDLITQVYIGGDKWLTDAHPEALRANFDETTGKIEFDFVLERAEDWEKVK